MCLVLRRGLEPGTLRIRSRGPTYLADVWNLKNNSATRRQSENRAYKLCVCSSTGGVNENNTTLRKHGL